MKNKKIFRPTDPTPLSACERKNGYFHFTPFCISVYTYNQGSIVIVFKERWRLYYAYPVTDQCMFNADNSFAVKLESIISSRIVSYILF